MLTFPSFGYILAVKPWNVADVIARFTARGIAAAAIGSVGQGSRITVSDGVSSENDLGFRRAAVDRYRSTSEDADGMGRMTAPHQLRVAILAHSTNPRGGVVHAIELADALTRLGHEAVVHAPDERGRGFFRAPLTPAIAVTASAAAKNVADTVRARIADYVQAF